MLQLNVILSGEGALKDVPGDQIIHLNGENDVISVTALEKGMASGRPSVGFIFRLPDGRTVLAETSMRLFLAAATLFAAQFRDQL